MDRALDAVFARPAHHLVRGLAVLDRAQPDFAQQLDTRLGQILEVLLDHAMLDHRRAGMHLDPRGPEILVPALRRNRHRLEAHDVLGTARHVHLAGRNQRRDPAVQRAVDPVQLLLARRVIAHDRVHVTVDQPRAQPGLVGIDHAGRPVGIQIPLRPDRTDLAIKTNHAIPVDQRLLEPSREDLRDVADHQLCLRHGGSFLG